MLIDQYVSAARQTAIYPEEIGLAYVALGLAGEAGEVADKVKKLYRDGGGELTADRREALIAELGDVLWYAANMCYELDVSGSEVAARNLEKLRKRAAAGTLAGDGDNR